MVLALNMMDEVRNNGGSIDVTGMADALGTVSYTHLAGPGQPLFQLPQVPPDGPRPQGQGQDQHPLPQVRREVYEKDITPPKSTNAPPDTVRRGVGGFDKKCAIAE